MSHQQQDKFAVIITNKMSNKYKFGLLILSLGIILFLLNIGFVSSICYIETSSATCTNNGNNIVMRLSASTNAHGELAGQGNYNNVLCCEEGSGDTTCIANNEILGLASVTNAHAERPELTSYVNNVCYDGLANCGFVNTTLASNEREIIGISADTNAHLGGFNDYKSITNNRRIVCTVVSSPASCDLTGASWESPNANVGGSVEMIVDGSLECGGVEISFEVLQGSNVIATPAPVNFGSGSTQVNGTWANVGPADSTPYTFRATVVSNPSETQTSSNSLLVEEEPEYCSVVPVVYCRDYTNVINSGEAPQSDCDNNACVIDVESSFSSSLGIDCDASNVDECFCYWNTTISSCEPGISYLDAPACGNGIREGGEICDGADKDGYACTDFDEYTGGTLSCNSNCNGFIFTQCNGYVACDNDGIRDTGEVCDGTDTDGFSCADFDEYTGGPLGCSNCNFNFGQCTGTPAGNGVGTCFYTADTTDTCDDEETPGLLVITWLTSWEWSPENPGQNDPQNLAGQCAADNGVEDSLACPAQIPLPFFSIGNLIAAVVLIALIYWTINVRKGRKKR